MSGPQNIKITKYKDIAVSKCGTPLSGLISASYSFKRNVNTIFARGQTKPTATYAVLPDIDISYTGYNGSFDISEANSFSKISISGTSGSIAADFALLTGFSFELSVDSFLSVTKTFTGFSKPSGGVASGLTGNPTVIKRQDFGGSIPGAISGNHLQKVSGEISIDRQFIGEFATRKPYASVVNFPIVSSITYEAFTDAMDSVTINALESACQNPSSLTANVGISACGFSFNIGKAHITSIEYKGGDANSTGSFQTISITYSSYEGFDGIKPVIILDNESSC